jgi:predicted GNAT family acetyltransferase
MEIIREDNDGKGAFRAIEGDIQMGEMTYIWRGENKILIFHTGVEPEFEGQGIGKQLMMEAVDFSRKNDVKIIPLCPFVKAQYKRMPEIRDTLAD